jgi:O-antigen/teichoic acid export membrane protein
VTSSARRRVASNTLVQLAGKGVVLAIGLVSIAVLTRYLGPDDYGKYTLALMYMQLFGVLADVGIYTTVVREISKAPERTEELVGNALALRLVLALCVIALACGVSLLLPYEHQVRVAILLAGGPLLIGMVNTTFVAILQSRLRMSRAVVGDVAGRAASLLLVLVVVWLDLGIYLVLVAAAGGAAVTLIVTWRLTRPLARVRPLGERAIWRSLLKTAIPLGLALAINAIYFRADTLIISLYEPYSEVGLYTLAYRVLELALVVGTVFLNTTFPIVSEAVASDPARARRAIQASSEVCVVLGAPLVAGGLVLAPQIVELAGGEDFSGSAEPLWILLAAGALAWVNGVFGYALIARERQASALWLNVTALIFNVGLNFLLIPRYGIVAAAIVTVASELVILLGSIPLMRRWFDFFPVPRTLVPAVAVAAAMAGLLWLLDGAPLPVLVPLGAAVYGGLLWLISPTARGLVTGLRAS